MQKTLICAVCLALGLSVVSVAEDNDGNAKPAVDGKEVAALIEQLNHKRLAKRDAATKKLKEMGEAVHGVLKETLQQKDLPTEAAIRIRSILKAAADKEAAKSAKNVTDPATGMTFVLSPDGQTITATDNRGRTIWKMSTRQYRGESLTIEKGTLVVNPVNMRIDIGTGKLLSVGGPPSGK